MKILYFSPHPTLNLAAPSGPGRHMREMIRAFEKSDHQVHTLIMGGETMDTSIPIDFQTGTMRRFVKKILPGFIWQTIKDIQYLYQDYLAQKALQKTIVRIKPDLIYERGFYLMKSGGSVSNEFLISHILELNAPYPEEKAMMEGKGLFHFISKYKERRQVTDADVIVVVSSAMKTYLTNRHRKVNPRQIVVTPNAIHPEAFIRNPEMEIELKKTLGWDDGEIIIGFVGSIFPYHGVERLIDAFAHLIPQFAELRLLLVGDGEILPELQSRASDLGVRDQIIFTGNLPPDVVQTYIGIMDICVMPASNWYGSPVKIFEYAAMGKLVIAPNNIPMRDVMVDGEDGYLIEDSTASLEAALLDALKHPAEAKKMALKFMEKVHMNHTWEQMLEHIMKTLDYYLDLRLNKRTKR